MVIPLAVELAVARMTIPTLTIVGVGLIGGSIGLAAKKRGVARVVRGLGRDRTRLERALALGAITEFSLDPAQAAASSDLIIVCTPVDTIVPEIVSLARRCRPGTLLTDVGSTKAIIVGGVENEIPGTARFVGSHPLAGSEKQGAEFASADLLQDRWTMVTPTDRTDAGALQQVAEFWRGLGSKVRLMDPAEHDRALAMTSHLPHLLAAALAGILPQTWNDLTATGFRDTTRIAAGDPELWSAIFAHNRDSVLDALHLLQARLAEFQTALEAHDHPVVHRLLNDAKQVRDSLNSASPPT